MNIVGEVLQRTGYLESLEAEVTLGGAVAIEAEGRLENLAELMTVTALEASRERSTGGPLEWPCPSR